MSNAVSSGGNPSDHRRVVPVVEVEPLERRVLLSSPAELLTKPIRQDLLDRLTLPIEVQLQQKLDDNKMGAFDGLLLDYMRNRDGNAFFWNSDDLPAIKNYINTEIATAPVIQNADNLLAHRFPNGNSEFYSVQLNKTEVDWSTTNSNPEFVHTLNRHEFWLELSQAYVVTGQSRYANELIAQLASWSEQSGFGNPDEPPKTSPWQPMDVSIRANSWTWAYQQLVGSSAWTPAANTLMLWRIWQHGDFLRRVEPYALNTNRALFEAQGLLQIGHLFPEFDPNGDWRKYGRKLLFAAMDAQLNPDGGHVESSPGYAQNVILALLELYWLDKRKGDDNAWPAERLQRLGNAARAHMQLLTPDGKLAPLSDTYRTPVGPYWNRPRIILNDKASFPAAKPRLRDVWLFGASTASSLTNAPIYPAIPKRANTYSLPQSGYSVLRSGADSSARQIIFDAGPTGGGHGHFDLLNFELFGYGKPLISDPGLYTYDTSARRNWAISTPAHNTISIDNRSHDALEGIGNANISSGTIRDLAGGYQVTGSHRGYGNLAGAPEVTRSLWFDGDDVMLVVDFGESSKAHTFTQSFLLPTTSTGSDLAGGRIHTNGTGGRVRIQALLQDGQTAHRQTQIGGSGSPNVFVSNDPDAGIANDATRFYIDQTAKTAIFITLITTFTSSTAPNITAQLLSAPSPTGFSVQIYRDGKKAEVIPFFARPGDDFRPAAPVAGTNDIAIDSKGRLHLAFNDRDAKNLKYAVRDADGRWSALQTIDAGYEAGGWPAIAIDEDDVPSVAYFDGAGGDLRFARLLDNAWQIQTVDKTGSVGLYPSMVLDRDGRALISYYQRTLGDLRLAVETDDGWRITTVDSVGNVGRSTSIARDPNSKNAVAIAYDDSTTGDKRIARQSDRGWIVQTVDDTMPTGGGYTSLAFEPTKSNAGYLPTVSYYDSSNSALKFARLRDDGKWATSTLVAQGVQGLYTSLYYDVANRPTVFFFKKTNETAYRATYTAGAWEFSYLGTGGREVQTARHPNGAVAFTNLDTDGLRVEWLRS